MKIDILILIKIFIIIHYYYLIIVRICELYICIFLYFLYFLWWYMFYNHDLLWIYLLTIETNNSNYSYDVTKSHCLIPVNINYFWWVSLTKQYCQINVLKNDMLTV